MVVVFDGDTDLGFGGSKYMIDVEYDKAVVDAYFTFSGALATDYTMRWVKSIHRRG